MLLRRFLNNERGATAIEYALIAALLGVVVAGAITALGVKLYGTFGNISSKL